MDDEGKKIRFTDLTTSPTKRIKAHYHKSDHKISLRRKRRNLINFIPIVLLVIAITISVVNSTPFRLIQIALSLKHENILIGFQNSAELRPTGGFWGSFGILEVGNNIIDSHLYFDTNPYKNDNQVYKDSSVPLPKPMQETWPDRNQSFVNANYSVDFPETAKSLEWFLNQGWSQNTNAVFAISSLSVIDLLKLTGEIEVDQTKINADNFTEILSQRIDQDYWLDPNNITTNEPKTILKDLAPKLIEKTKNLSKPTLYKFFLSQMIRGRFLAFFNDTSQESITKSLGISGEIKSAPVDYLSINNANLNGGKSSLNITQSATYSITKGATKPIAELQITRECNDSWPNILNRNYVRVLVPLGSKLTNATLDDKNITSEIEQTEEMGKTALGVWFSVSPSQKNTLKLRYELPFENSSLRNYNLIWQKQPGTLADNVTAKVEGKIIYSGILDQNYLNLHP